MVDEEDIDSLSDSWSMLDTEVCWMEGSEPDMNFVDMMISVSGPDSRRNNHTPRCALS